MTDHDCPAPDSVRRISALALSRRTLLTGTAMALSGLFKAGLAAAAAPDDRQIRFYRLSVRLTEKQDLSPITSGRILAALLTDDAEFSAYLDKLMALGDGTTSGMALKTEAAAQGLEAQAMKIVAAWYTGTVETKKGPIVVAYRDALMYRPVADGLTVPTYCNQGPLWWTGLPPEIARMPVNLPKVL